MVYILYDITSSRTFYPFSLCLVICDWSTLTLSSINGKYEYKSKRKENNKKLSLLLTILTLFPLQGFFSGETDFHFHQLLSNFLKYSSSNYPSSYSYSIFAVNFPGNSLFLKSLSSAMSNFSCLLTSIFILFSNSSNDSLAFPKSSFFF